jgi:hypothetical protein
MVIVFLFNLPLELTRKASPIIYNIQGTSIIYHEEKIRGYFDSKESYQSFGGF